VSTPPRIHPPPSYGASSLPMPHPDLFRGFCRMVRLRSVGSHRSSQCRCRHWVVSRPATSPAGDSDDGSAVRLLWPDLRISLGLRGHGALVLAPPPPASGNLVSAHAFGLMKHPSVARATWRPRRPESCKEHSAEARRWSLSTKPARGSEHRPSAKKRLRQSNVVVLENHRGPRDVRAPTGRHSQVLIPSRLAAPPARGGCLRPARGDENREHHRYSPLRPP
jgi:hypothetical protein